MPRVQLILFLSITLLMADSSAFVERLGVSFPIPGYGQDPLTGYGEVPVLPTTFVINPEGLFQRRFAGPISAADIVEEISAGRSKSDQPGIASGIDLERDILAQMAFTPRIADLLPSMEASLFRN